VLFTGQVSDPVTGRLVDLPVQAVLKRSVQAVLKRPVVFTREYCVLLFGYKYTVLTKQNSQLQTPLHTVLKRTYFPRETHGKYWKC